MFNKTEEWINDVKYLSPYPHPNHGIVYGEILNCFYNHLKGKGYRLFSGTDLLLTSPSEPIHVADLKKPVVPDLFVVCENKFELVGNTIVAVPDYICEIVSPNSIEIETIKKDFYLSKGVKEHWIVNYLNKTIEVYFDGKETTYTFDTEVKVNTLKDLTICLKDIKLF